MAYQVWKYQTFTLKMGESALLNLNDGGTTIKCALLKDSYTYDLQSDSTMDDIRDDGGTNHEVDAGGGYDVGGEEVDNISWEQDGDDVVLKGDAVEWDPSTITASYAVFYIDGASDSDRDLIAVADFVGEKSSENDRFKVLPEELETGGKISIYDHATP